MKKTVFTKYQKQVIQDQWKKFKRDKQAQKYGMSFWDGLRVADPLSLKPITALGKLMGVKEKNRESPSQFYERWYGPIWPEYPTAKARRKFIIQQKRKPVTPIEEHPDFLKISEICAREGLEVNGALEPCRTNFIGVRINGFRCRIQTVKIFNGNASVEVNSHVPEKYDFLLVRITKSGEVKAVYVIPTRAVRKYQAIRHIEATRFGFYIPEKTGSGRGRKPAVNWSQYHENWKQLSKPRNKRGLFLKADTEYRKEKSQHWQ